MYCSKSIGIDINQSREHPSSTTNWQHHYKCIAQPTGAIHLHIALGVLLRDYKTILGYTYDYGITYSYEILRFKKSAAVVAAKDPSVHWISSAESGLVQTIVDNFDADIHSPNGKLSTHSLAMILTQPSTPGNETDADTIDRL